MLKGEGGGGGGSPKSCMPLTLTAPHTHRIATRDCCTFEFVKARMDLVQRGVCGSQAGYTMLRLFSHGWGVDLMVNTGNRIAMHVFSQGKPVWMVNNNWHYAKGVCPKQNLECYFEKVMEDREPPADRPGCRESSCPRSSSKRGSCR